MDPVMKREDGGAYAVYAELRHDKQQWRERVSEL
jgi:hypothetical protein